MRPTFRRDLRGVPEHYRLTIQGVPCDVHDVVDALNPPHYVAEALTYLMRYKRKPSENPDMDLHKAVHVLLRQLFRGNPERAVQSLRTLSDVAKELADLREALNAQQATGKPECRQKEENAGLTQLIEKQCRDALESMAQVCGNAQGFLAYVSEIANAQLEERERTRQEFLEELSGADPTSAHDLYEGAPECIRVMADGPVPSNVDRLCELHMKRLAEYRTRLHDVYSAYTVKVSWFSFSERLIAKEVLQYTDAYVDRTLAALSQRTPNLAKIRALMVIYSKYTMVLKSLAENGPSRCVLCTFHEDHLRGTYTEQMVSTPEGALDVLGGISSYADRVLKEFTAFAEDIAKVKCDKPLTWKERAAKAKHSNENT